MSILWVMARINIRIRFALLYCFSQYMINSFYIVNTCVYVCVFVCLGQSSSAVKLKTLTGALEIICETRHAFRLIYKELQEQQQGEV